jgi:twinkle protein
MTISDKHLQWLESRGIGAETAVRSGLFTDKQALAFPLIEEGRAVGTKFRGPNKTFWQAKDGKKTFWNADILNDPALLLEAENGGLPLVITEGEIDALTAIECGFPLTVSVPEGAPPAADDPVSNNPLDDARGKFQFMFNNRDRLKRIKRFVLAVDSDPPGMRLAAELVRRLGASRCLFVTYPEDCKDLNEVLLKHGREAVAEALHGARPYPVKGLYRLEDYPPVEPVKPIKTGWPTLDKHFGLFPGAFTVVTGIPSHGKTTWTMGLSVNIAKLYAWKTAIFSPEMPTVPQLHNKLRTIASKRPLYRLLEDRQLLRETDQFLNDAFVFIDADPEEGADEDMTLEWVCERVVDAVHRYGIRHFILDPWNEVEHSKPAHESMPDYIGRGIRMLKRLAKQYQIAITVVVHPTKAVGGENPRMPNLYDCEGSAHWFNKPDLGVIVGREADNPHTIIRIAKVRFDGTGEKGDVFMRFDRETASFEMLDSSYSPGAVA